MNYDINVFVYGKGKKLVGEYSHLVTADNADTAAEMARQEFIGQGDNVIVRGVNPSLNQDLEPIKRKPGRPPKDLK